MPGAPSFIALDWGTSSLRAWRFGESPNPQEKREFPWGIMKLPSQAATREDAFHDTFLRVCGDWLAQTPCPGPAYWHTRYWLAACSAVRKGGNQQLIYLARSLSRVWRSS